MSRFRAGLIAHLLLASCASPLFVWGQKQAAAPQTETLPAQDTPETETVHILVGRSIIINMQTRLRKIYISNPGVLESTTTTPTQVVLTAKSAGSCNVVFWDENSHSRMLEVSADVDISGFRDALQLSYPNQPIDARAEQGRIILSGTVSDQAVLDNVLKMAQFYSKDVVDAVLVHTPPHGKQIMLKVRFAEVDRTKAASFGLNIFSLGAANTPGSISTQQFSGPAGSGQLTGTIGGTAAGTKTEFNTQNLLNIFLYRPDLNLAATLQALQTKSILQILAEPDLLAISGEQAHFLAGGEFPYPVVQGTAAGGAGAVTLQFRPYGIKLDFTGTIEPDNSIRLKVAPEVSSLDYGHAVTISGFTVPALSTRRAETAVELRDGQSFGIAGLLDSNTTVQMSKIPGIGDIPVLGELFKSHDKNFNNSELLVIVTPTIVDPLNMQTPAPKEPKTVIPDLDQQRFDEQFPGAGKATGTPAPATGK